MSHLINLKQAFATRPAHGVEMTPEEILRKVRVIRETSIDKDVRYHAQIAINSYVKGRNILKAVELLRSHAPAYVAAL